jgi:hypothetical protein
MLERITRALALGAALAALLCATAAPALAAKKDDGPYAPFPEGDPSGDAVRFVERLNQQRARQGGAPVSVRQLVKGRSFDRVGGRGPHGSVDLDRLAPARRAGVSAAASPDRGGLLPFALAAALLALAALGLELRGRRARSPE